MPPAPTNREDLMNTWVATYYSEDDCLTAPEWDTLWDFYDSDGKHEGRGKGVREGGGGGGRRLFVCLLVA